jgi:hypothetical protein
MRSFVPFVLVFLAIFIAACIAYIAWELSSDTPGKSEPASSDADHTSTPDEP